MYLLMYIYIVFLRFIYFFLKMLPVQNRIVFISRQSNKPSNDFVMLEKELKKLRPDFEIVMVTKKMAKNSSAIIKGSLSILKSMKYLATSKVCITDGYNVPISVLKHKSDLKVFQIWHSLGAIKKFGYQALDTPKDKKIAKIMCMHKNYDFINSSSSYMTEYYSKAFGYSTKYFYPIGLPRIDYLLNNEKILKKQIYNKYPKLKGKKVILYAPTFRNSDDYKMKQLIDNIDLKKYALIVKIHPNMNVNIEEKNNLYTCKEFGSISLMTVANYVITDYSSMAIEATIIDKPVYLYTYDIDSYKKEPGLNLDLEKELPGCVFKNAKSLYNAINRNSYDKDVLKRFKNKYIVSTKGDVTLNLAKFIIEKGGISDEKN